MSGSEAGFSLVEFLIAVTIFLAVMAAVFGVFRIGLVMRDSVNDRSETAHNARTAINSIGGEAVNAGLGYSRTGAVVPDDLAFDLFGIPRDPDAARDLFTGVMGGNEVGSSLLSAPGEMNDFIAFIYRDQYFNGGDPLIISNAAAVVDSVVLETPAGGCAECRPWDLYLIESADGSKALGLATDVTLGKFVTLGRNGPLGLNRSALDPPEQRSILTPCTLTVTTHCFNYQPQATAKKVYLMSYGVNNEGTLVRTTYGSNTGATAAEQVREHPLAYNVRRFQVRYLLSDGTVSDDPSNLNTDQARMNEVVQVEIRITVRADDGGSSTRTKTIDLTSTFSTRNLRYDIE